MTCCMLFTPKGAFSHDAADAQDVTSKQCTTRVKKMIHTFEQLGDGSAHMHPWHTEMVQRSSKLYYL